MYHWNDRKLIRVIQLRSMDTFASRSCLIAWQDSVYPCTQSKPDLPRSYRLCAN